MSTSFTVDKARVLRQVDLSRKGSVDAAIAPLLDYVNAQNCFYSTSSCAGRLVLFAEGRDQRKKGCHWLLVSHDPLDLAQVEESLGQERAADEGYVYFKFEPFVLHTMCATLADATLMFQAAVGSGFRNSGMSYGKRARWMVAVRSTLSLETPLAYSTTLLTPAEYRRHVVDIGNAKLQENAARVQRFHQHLQTGIENRGRESKAVSGKKTQQVRDKASRHLHRDSRAVDPDSDPERDLATLFS